MKNYTVKSWIEKDNKMNVKGTGKTGKRIFAILLVVVTLLISVCGAGMYFVNASVDLTPYKNTKYLVNWDNYVFPKISTLKSGIAKDFTDLQSLDEWNEFDEASKTEMGNLYKVAKNVNSYYKKVIKTKSTEGKTYYVGFTKKNLTNMRNALVKMKTLYQTMESKLVATSVEFTGYYKSQTTAVTNVLKYFTSGSVKSIYSVSTDYSNKIPKSYFKITYKTINMSEDEEVEAYNSLYTSLVRGCVTVTYSKENSTKFNDTVVSTGTGKGYVIYPMSLVGRVKYVKVTYVVKEAD